MTPIKVGPYTVHACLGLTSLRSRSMRSGATCFAVTDGAGYLRYFNFLPMALRHAAELAGIERVRVVFAPDPREMNAWSRSDHVAGIRLAPGETTNSETLQAHLRWLGERAHEDARRRYAALGGAA